jgi:hypothetical protein
VRLSATGDLEKAAGALAVLSWVRQAKAIVRSVEVAEPDLEAVFLHLTGRALRD